MKLGSKDRGKIIDVLVSNCDCGPASNAWTEDDRDLLETFSDSKLNALAHQRRAYIKNATDDDDDSSSSSDDSSYSSSSADSSMPARRGKAQRNAGEDIHSFDLSHPVAGGAVQAGGKGTKDEYEEVGYKPKTSLGHNQYSENAVDKWMRVSNAPPEVKNAVAFAREQEQQYKIGLVKKIIHNVMDDKKRNLIGNQLMQKPKDELEMLVATLPPAQPMVRRGEKPIYFGGAVPEGGTVVNSLSDNERKNILALPRLDPKEIVEEMNKNSGKRHT